MLDSQEDVTHWLADIGLAHYAKRFTIAGLVGERLLALTQEDLVDLGVTGQDLNMFRLAREALVTGDAPPTAPDPAAPDYALALNAEVITFCRDLAQHPLVPWVDTVSEQWPGPVAHEYHRLRELLADGHIVPAIWQLKDLAEILLKFPALIMARDVVEHGSEATARQVRRALFSGPLSFGKWAELVRETLAPTARQAAAKLVCPQLAGLFLMPTEKPKPTSWLHTLMDLVTWRNEAFGHGALRLDPADFSEELQTYVGKINRALAEQVAANVWSNVRLRGEGPEVPDLSGWRTIRHRHLSSDATHVEVDAALILGANGRSLRLTPLVALRRCTVCSKQDVFLYDSLAGRSREHSNFVVIDYLGGHRMTALRHRAPDLAAEADRTEGPSEFTPLEGTADAIYGDRQIEELLQDKALEARYIEPTYLRQPFETFLQTHDRGVFWLTAPGHVGKSIFVKGLADPTAVGGKPLGADILVVALFIKREIGQTAQELQDELLTRGVLQNGFGLIARGANFPQLTINASDPAVEFVQHLKQVMKLKPSRFNKVILCLDGLDELPKTADGKASIVDFLPAPDALPEGLYLLVTSRPLAECPPQVRTILNHRFTGAEAFQRCMLDLDANRAVTDPLTRGYLDLLHKYYEREIAERRLSDLRQAFATFTNGRTEVRCVNDLSRRLPRPLADAVNREWSDLTHGRVNVRSPATAPSLAETVALPVIQRYEEAFHAVLDRAGSRFLYVAHLTGLLRDRTLALTSIADLPKSAGLYEHFLRQLERTLAGSETDGLTKTWEFVQRVILLLTAAEQAHEWDYRLEPAGYSDPEFRGLPLDVLADLLGEPGRTYRLVFALYSVKEILAAWKGEQARDASYRLGLKDFVATVAALWPEKVVATHEQLARDGYEKWQAQSTELLGNDAVALHTAAMLLAHATLSGDSKLAVVLNAPQIRDDYLSLGKKYHTQAQYRLAVQWWSRTLWAARTITENVPTIENRNDLAMALMNKGIALRNLGQSSAALECYEEAIDICRRLVETEGRLELANDLAMALMNKGNTLRNLGQLSVALECYEEAIGIRRRLVETEGRLELADGLAATLMNKGNTLMDLGQLSAAAACCDEAIELWKRIMATGLRHLTPDLVEGVGLHFDIQRRLDQWETAAQDVIRVLEHAQPFLQGDTQSALFQREYENFIARLRKLTLDEQEQLYAALGERAAEVRRLIEG